MSNQRRHVDVVDLTVQGPTDRTRDLEIVDLEIVDLDIVATSDAQFPASWSPPPGWRYVGWRVTAKRLLDFFGGLCLIVALLPAFAVVALVVRLSSPGAAIYSQERVGQHGRKFRMLKFRTMHVNADERLHSDADLWAKYVANDYKLPPQTDPRLTPVGDFLRKTSLDELPQLFNVMHGSMSLVGPRPVVAPEYDHYRRSDSYPWLKPGATGPWQVSGRCSISYPERSTIVDDYAESWSLTSDIKILLKTIPAVLGRDGAY